MTAPRSSTRLTLFMTRGMSLAAWERSGTLDREIALYRRLSQRGASVGIFSYGGPEELDYADRLSGIRVLCNRWRLRPSWYERWGLAVHGRWLGRSDVFKTNQINGGLLAMRAARRWRKPLVARAGYMWSEFVGREQGEGSPAHDAALAAEAQVFGAARRIVVSTRSMAHDVARRVAGGAAKTAIIPNFVVPEWFDANGVARDIDVLFVGRLVRQKNIGAFIEAIVPLEAKVTMVGDGPERPFVEAARLRAAGRLAWHASLTHRDLARLMARAKVFVLPSLWEGHPKALIEAMAAGAAVIGADSPGIREVIRHGETGWLCGTGPDDIRRAIAHLLASPDLRFSLGQAARAYALENFALDRIASLELALLDEVVREAASLVATDADPE